MNKPDKNFFEDLVILIEDSNKFKKIHPFVYWFLVLIFIFSALIAPFTIYLQNSTINNLTTENDKLRFELTPFKTLALSKYPGDEAKALIKLSKDLQKIDKELNNFLDYSHVAKLNSEGYEVPGQGGGLYFPNEYSNLMDGASNFFRKNNTYKFQLSCNEEQLLNVIERKPKYPFAYFFLATCMKNRNYDGWKPYAIKAKEIFEITTQFEFHNYHHDFGLEQIDALLEE